MSTKNVNDYFDKLTSWKDELDSLRDLIKGKSLEESIKWGRPCYSLNGKLIIGLSGFKNHYGIWFFHGALIENKFNLLINAQEGKTQGMRQMKFDAATKPVKSQIMYYIDEAIKNANEGRFVKMKKKTLTIPEALKAALSDDSSFKKEFGQMTESQKKEFAEYISAAKREATVQSRISKIKSLVKKGEGLHDKYKKNA